MRGDGVHNQALGIPHVRRHGRREAVLHFAERLAESGAVMIVPSPTFLLHVVGHISWPAPDRVFWYDAEPKATERSHWFPFTDLCRVGRRGVCFFRGEEIAGYLCRLESVNIFDLDRLRGTRVRWKLVAPDHHDAICAACRTAEPAAGLRSCRWANGACGEAASLPDRTSTVFPVADRPAASAGGCA